jgi:hypothetical protein
MVQLSAAMCNCIAILWVSLVSSDAITLCVASQRVFIITVVYFVIDSVRKLLDTPSYFSAIPCCLPLSYYNPFYVEFFEGIQVCFCCIFLICIILVC